MADPNNAMVPVREQGNVTLQCPKLTESNYTTWSILMEQILKAYGLWDVVSTTGGAEVGEKKTATTKAMIFQTLPEDILMQVAQYPSAKEVWDSIKVRYLGAYLVQKARLHTLRSELEVLKMKENETVDEFAGKLSSVRAKFRSLGSHLKDKILVRKLLNSVSKKFLPIIASIEQYSDVDKMAFEEAVGRIKAFEARLKSFDTPEENDQNKLLLASTSSKRAEESESWKHGNGRGGRNQGRGGGRGGGRGRGCRDRSELRCYECGDFGHFAYECTKWKAKDEDKRNEEATHLAQFGDDENPALL